MKMNKPIKKGFTLIEIIVVMAVILVLSSFFIPKFNGYREKATKLKVIDTGRQIYSAAFVSYMENDNKYSGESIQSSVKELLGITDISVAKASDKAVTIEYSVDDKKYSLEVDMDNNSYIIKDSDKQIYPS